MILLRQNCASSESFDFVIHGCLYLVEDIFEGTWVSRILVSVVLMVFQSTWTGVSMVYIPVIFLWMARQTSFIIFSLFTLFHR